MALQPWQKPKCVAGTERPDDCTFYFKGQVRWCYCIDCVRCPAEFKPMADTMHALVQHFRQENNRVTLATFESLRDQ